MLGVAGKYKSDKQTKVQNILKTIQNNNWTCIGCTVRRAANSGQRVTE